MFALAAVVASIAVIRGAVAIEKVKLATGYASLIFLFLLSMVVLLDIIRNKIDLSQELLEELWRRGMSRFQLLVYIVIAFSFL